MNNEISTKNLLNVIDFEIAKFDSEVSRSGWNFWILLVSLASLSWILLGELDSSQQDWHLSLFVFLASSLILDFIGNFRSLLSSSNQFSITNRFHVASLHFGSLRTSYAFVALKNLVILAITLFTKDFLDFYWFILAFYGVYTFLAILILIASYFDVPIRAKNNKETNWITLLIIAIYVFILNAIVTDIITGVVTINVSEYKIGFALLGISFLISSILAVSQNPYHKDRLVEVRRDFLLNNMSFEDAKRQVEILLLGMQADDFVQQEVNILLEKHRSFNSIYSAIERKYASGSKNLTPGIIKKMGAKKISKTLAELGNAIKSTDDDFAELEKNSKEADLIYKKILRKISFLGKGASLTDLLVSKIDNSLDLNIKRLNQIRSIHKNLHTLLDTTDSRINELTNRRKK